MAKQKKSAPQESTQSKNPQLQNANQSQSQNTTNIRGYVKKEIAFGGMILCLVFGLILGSLLPSILNGPKTVQVARQKTQSVPVQQNSPDAFIDQKHIAELEMACAKNPKDQQAWVRLADACFDAKLVDKAIKAYETALTLGAPTADIITDLGTMYRAKKDFLKARELFQQAQKLDPNHLQSRLNEGVVLYFDLNQKDAAFAIWNKVLALKPDMTMPDGTPLKTVIIELGGK